MDEWIIVNMSSMTKYRSYEGNSYTLTKEKHKQNGGAITWIDTIQCSVVLLWVVTPAKHRVSDQAGLQPLQGNVYLPLSKFFIKGLLFLSVLWKLDSFVYMADSVICKIKITATTSNSMLTLVFLAVDESSFLVTCTNMINCQILNKEAYYKSN